MSSDEEEQVGECPMLARHRKEKKELRAKITAMKKSSKSSNKKQQKEVKEQIEKLEKELEEKQRLEKEEQMTGNEFLLTSISGLPPSQTGERVDSSSGPEDDSEEEEEEEEGKGLASKVYRTFKISRKKQKHQQKKKNAAEKEERAHNSDEERKRKEQGIKHAEKQQMKALLAKNSLKMIDIPADGDCMYQSVSHQLLEEGIEISARKLRKACAQYMREHREELEPFISETDIATPTTKHDDPSMSLWDRYIRGVENMADQPGGAWGGEMELKVVSEIYKKVILVYTVGPETPHKIGEQFSSPKDRPLRLVFLRHAYTLGEHYNSTVFV